MNSTLARGVVYDKADYAGFFRRLVATIIDILDIIRNNSEANF
jgi:hypothetical protein